MGSILSATGSTVKSMDRCETSGTDPNKRVKVSTYDDGSNLRIIPTLPDELSYQILARLPRIHYLNLKMVCRAWNAAITSYEISQLRRELGVSEEWLYVLSKVEANKLDWYALDPVFDPKTGLWSELPEMPFAKAQVLPTAFLADVLKPIATGMAPYKGKLYVPQSLYSWPFFFDIGGEIYDPDLNSWSTMPDGLGDGWPARQAGTKLGIVIDDKLYTLEPSSSLDSGQIKRYDPEEDTWATIAPQVPVNDFTDAEAPYLLAGLCGRLHVITKAANNTLQVMQAVVQNNTGSRASEENVIWTTVASRNFGTAELVSCQVLDV